MPASYTSGQPSNPRKYLTCWASSQRSHPVSTTRAMESGHLLHSALTRPSSANARHLKSRHPFVPAAQHLISSSDNNIRAAQWADYQWNAEWADNPTSLRTFTPDTHPPGITLPRRAWVRLNRLRTGVGRFRSCLYKWVWPPLRPVSVAQRNKPSIMLSSNVQSIDLRMDCMAWRFWTMGQPNGCSTPAPRSSWAKQWFEQLAQKKKIFRFGWAWFFVWGAKPTKPSRGDGLTVCCILRFFMNCENRKLIDYNSIIPKFNNIINSVGNGIVGGKLVRPAIPCRTCFWPATRERLPTTALSFHAKWHLITR